MLIALENTLLKCHLKRAVLLSYLGTFFPATKTGIDPQGRFFVTLVLEKSVRTLS